MTDLARSGTGRDSIMKMLLSTGPVVSTSSTAGSGLPSPTGETFDDNPNMLTTYLHQLAGCLESEIDVIVKDHCYARPWNWKPENVYVKPVKKLFFGKARTSGGTDKLKQEEEVDVEGDTTEPLIPPYDLTRARHVMDEFQRLANFARPDENDDWEEKIEKILWSPVQNRIFTKVLRILSAERLARLAKASSLSEPVFRRTSIDTAAKRFRETLASAGWDWRIAQWLHNLLFENLPQEYMAIYLDILQTLRLKIPQLIDKIIAVQPNLNAKGGSITWETLGPLLKRSWDPVISSLNANRPKKLPGNPILIIAPSGISTSVSSRQHKWTSQLGALGMVVNIHVHPHTHIGIAANRMTMMACMDQLVQATRTKIQDVRSDCPGRPIILIGFNTGAALACQVAQMEHVTAVICLGFPFTTVEGKRGTPDDTLMDIRCPVMFVIGQNATLVRPDDLEDLREKMLVETSLVVIGTADDHLRISTAKKISEGITQSMVDRCILDEVGDFVGSILLQPHPLPLRPNPLSNSDKTIKKEYRKRKNSTSSSVESEPHSPSMKKTRPITPITPSSLHGGSTGSLVRTGTLSTQPTLVAIGGASLSQASMAKRKPRVISNQKVNLPDQLISPRLATQANTSNATGGITLNIGSLASLAPIGPLRLTPTSAGQTVTATTKMNTVPRPSTAYSKMPKMMPTSTTSPQNTPKMKTVMSTNKSFSKVMTSYKHINITDKGGEAKLVNVLTTAGNQVRVSASTAAAMHVKSVTNTSGALSALLQSRRSPMGIVSGIPMGKGTSASSILLTPSVSTANTHTMVSSSSPTTPKVMDNNGASSSSSSSDRTISTSSRPLDVSKMSLLPPPASTSNKNYPHPVSTGNNVLMLTDSLHNSRNTSMLVPISSQNPITILPLSSKMKMGQKSMKTVPKITVNSCNLQRATQRVNKPPSPIRKKIANDFDDDLGNILDIPIIFAKDGDNLNAIEKSPSISQMPLVIDSYDKNIAKLSGTTKVVLISNKHDRIQQNVGNLANAQMQAVVRASGPQHHISRTVLQNRPQNPSVSNAVNRAAVTQMQTTVPRLNQATIKYTKIILAKRNSISNVIHEDKSEQVILTKNPSKIISYDSKNEHRYAQILPRHQIKFQELVQDDTLEIEDAIKTNIIERRIPTVSEIDLTSPAKNGHGIEQLNNLDSNTEMELVKTDAFLSDTNLFSEINEQQE